MSRGVTLRIVVGYALIAALYIVVSDLALFSTLPEHAGTRWTSLRKGLAFVAVTSLVLAWLLTRIRSAEVGRYRSLFLEHNAPMLLIDPADGSIVEANPAAAAFYRCSVDHLRTLRIQDINTLDDDNIAAELRRAVQREKQRFQFVHRLTDGEEREVEVQSGPVNLFERPVLLSIIHDVTERRRAERTMERTRQLYAMLSHTNQLLVRGTTRQALFAGACQIAVRHGGFCCAWVGLVEADGEVRPAAHAGEGGDYIDGVGASIDPASPRSAGATGRAIRSGTRVVIRDFLADPANEPWRQAARAIGIRASAAFPLRENGAVVGALNLYAQEADFFGDAELATLDEMVMDLSYGLNNLARTAELEAATAVVESSPVVLFRWLPKSGWRTEFVSHNVSRWGWDSTRLTSGATPFESVVHADDWPRVVEARGRWLNGEQCELLPYRVLTATGETRWVEDRTTVQTDVNGAVLHCQGTLTDITERRRAEEDAHMLGLRLEHYVSVSPTVTYAIEIRDGGTVPVWVSQNILARSGWTVAEALQPGWWDSHVHPDDIEEARAGFGQAIEHGSARHEYRFLRRDGSEFHVLDDVRLLRDANGTPRHLVGTWTDITERRRAELALKESEARYRVLVDQSLVGIYVLDDGLLTYANPRTAEIFGYHPDELVGLAFETLVAEADRARVFEHVRARLAGDTDSLQYEFHAVRRDGTPVLVGAHGAVTQLRGRSVVLGVLQDITDKRHVEETIHDYVARLEAAVLGTVGAVAQMVELRDPYTAGHERRVGDLSANIAAEMGLDENVQRGLRVAGTVHDVGKIMVPAEILSKPGRLTAAEFELVKMHAEQGYEVLKDIAFPWPVAEVARQHHERVDGSGYPRGLKGEAILVEARIMAVADVVESMASHRPYRPAIGLEAALREIADNAGRRYDGDAVNACLRLFHDRGYRIPD